MTRFARGDEGESKAAKEILEANRFKMKFSTFKDIVMSESGQKRLDRRATLESGTKRLERQCLGRTSPERNGHFTVFAVRGPDSDLHILPERREELHQPPNRETARPASH